MLEKRRDTENGRNRSETVQKKLDLLFALLSV